MKERFIELLTELDKEKKYYGIIPLLPAYEKVKDELQITIHDFHKLLLELENSNVIYLEPINDYNRLSFEEKKAVYYDKIRGYLYYIGIWS